MSENIPKDADNGDLMVEPTVYCPDCSYSIPLDLMGDVFVGCCMCQRKWYVTPQRVTAHFLTAKQRDDVDETSTEEFSESVGQSMLVAGK